MNGVRRWSLRAHLLGMAGAVLVLSSVVGLAVTAGAYSQAKRRAVTAARDAAGQVAATIDRDLSQAAMLTAASAPGIGPILEQQAAVAANPDVCSLSFTGFGVFPPEGAVHILTGDGRVLCSSVRAAVGRSYAGASWFPRLAGGAPVTTGEGRDVISAAPAAIVAAPIQAPSGAVNGGLVQTLAVEKLAPALAETFGGPVRRQFALVDGEGRVLSSSIDPAQRGQAFPKIADGATAPDSRGTKRIWGVRSVAVPGWQLWAGTSEELALQTARAERRRLGLVLITALAAALGLTLLVNRRLVRPLRGLSATVARAETEPGARAAVAGPAELADLAQGLNHMLAAHQRHEELVTDLARDLEATAISLVEAREQERRSLAIALHDTTLQGLIAAMWQVDALVERGDGSPGLERLRGDLEALINQTRNVTTGLRPPALEEYGLGAAVDELARRTAGESGLTIEVDDRLLDARFVSAVEMLMYRMVQEALQNVRKHAQATNVRVVLERHDGLVRATVSDDGIGIDATVLTERARGGHLGVVSMRDTVRLAKGRFSITPGDPGTVVSVEVPVRPD
ncbi:MAG TPA: ATP-binding protein [Acidimicrobiia bacterium]|nr:ATP-binding protein [Acidimicrobiia bacterium]